MDFDGTGRKLPERAFKGIKTSYDNLGRYTQTRRLNSWRQIRNALDRLAEPCWVFRGQADARWALRTSLERVLERDDFAHEEDHLISLFKSRAHHYLASTPALENDLGWLALMQHHGAPTRLLDFTWSPYVALFFAVERTSSAGCAVWAVNGEACRERTEYMVTSLKEWHDFGLPESFAERPIEYWLNREPGLFTSIFLGNHCYLVCAVQPSRVNERMVSQQGVFLCPGKASQWDSFEANLLNQLALKNLPEYIEPAWNPPQIYRLVVPPTLSRLLK
jgi:hypothetical protein